MFVAVCTAQTKSIKNRGQEDQDVHMKLDNACCKSQF